jgi:alcohol-forming fatty acyl-CoA reductase
LKSFVYVSTAYVGIAGDTKDCFERVGESPIDPDSFLHYIETTTSEKINSETAAILSKHGYPNTYTLTKRIAESALSSSRENVPLVIVRPTIVGAAWRYPLPGWVDSLSGPAGLLMATALGILHVMIGDDQLVVDLIPVDYVINCILTAAWMTCCQLWNKSEVPVVHIGSSRRNGVSWRKMVDVMPDYFTRHPSDRTLGRIFFFWTTKKFVFDALHLALHVGPAALMDLKAKISGKRGRSLQGIQKLREALSTLEFFTTHAWTFDDSACEQMIQSMTPEDRVAYNFDSRDISWDAYFSVFSHGLKSWLLRENPVTFSSYSSRL